MRIEGIGESRTARTRDNNASPSVVHPLGFRRRRHAGPSTGTGMAADIVIRDAPDEGRFVAELGGHSASAWYERGPGVLRFVRVDISHDLIANGVGIQLMRVAMAQARAQGVLVEPACDFVAGYMRNHPETQDLLTSEGWRLLGR